MTALEILINARKLLRAKSRWTQRHLATDKNGGAVLVGSPNAVKFCATGAIQKVALQEPDPKARAKPRRAARARLRKLARLDEYYNVEDFNDNSEHRDVLSLFDQAIKEEKSQA